MEESSGGVGDGINDGRPGCSWWVIQSNQGGIDTSLK